MLSVVSDNVMPAVNSAGNQIDQIETLRGCSPKCEQTPGPVSSQAKSRELIHMQSFRRGGRTTERRPNNPRGQPEVEVLLDEPPRPTSGMP